MFTINPFGGMEEYNVYLCETDKTIIGAVKTYDLSFRIKWNNYSEAEFTFHRKYLDMITGEMKEHPLFDRVEQLRKILIEGVGYFVIQEADIIEDGLEEYKSCTVFSEEYELSQRYLEGFEINSGEVGSIDGVKFYDDTRLDKEHSLLDLVLEKFPTWDIGTIHPDLRNLERTYSIKREDVYDFLMNDVANTTKCVFVFNTFNNTINAYPEDSAGQDTDIYVSLQNLAQKLEVKYNADDIKTVLSVTGADDLDIRAVNLGLPYIMNLSYYETPEWMGEDLYNAYSAYKDYLSSVEQTYGETLQELYDLYDERDEIYNRWPSDDPVDWNDEDSIVIDEITWDIYGLLCLQDKEAIYKNKQSVQAEAGWGSLANENNSTYKKTYDILSAITSALADIKVEIENKDEEISALLASLEEMAASCSIENNFTQDQMLRLSNFMREDEYNDKNFVVIESDTDTDIRNLQEELLSAGEKELDRISRPQLEFDADIENLYAIKEFAPLKDSFSVGNYIYVEVREGYVMKVRILEIEVDTSDIKKLIVSFGNLLKLKDQSDIHAELLSQAASAGKSVASNSSYWQRGADKATETQERIANGLIDAATTIKSPATAGQEVSWDNYGIHLRKYENGVLSENEGWITNNQFLYSNDNFETVKSVFGEYSIGEGDEQETYWGLLAEAVIAGYIEGSTIVGGTIRSLNYNDGQQEGETAAGSFINLTDGTFSLAGGRLRYYYPDPEEDPDKTEFIISGIENEDKYKNFISVSLTPTPTIMLGQRDDNGETLGSNIIITDNDIRLSGKDGSEASLSGTRFNAPQAAFEQTYMGDYYWVKRTSNNHLSLKWAGG